MKRIFIKHNGCLNLSYDFNIAKSGLEKAGYEFVSNPSEADEIVFAGCGVRAAWVDCDRLEKVLLQSKLDKFRKMTTNVSTEEQVKMLELIAAAEHTNLKQFNG
jgi:tRNA A37 methylthiotransferase MiaB